MNPALKQWLIKHCGIAEDASEDDCRKALATALSKEPTDKGFLSPADYVKLAQTESASEASALEKKLDIIIMGQDTFGDRLDALETRSTEDPEPNENEEEKGKDPEGEKAPEKKDDVKERAPSNLEKAFSASSGVSEVGGTDIRTVNAIESYNRTKTAMTYPLQTSKGAAHPRAGQQVTEGDAKSGMRPLEIASEADLAVCGAYFKWMVNGQLKGQVPFQLKMTDHDKDLVYWALHNMKWGGVIHGDCSSLEGATAVKDRKLTEHEIKAILDDTTSGGLEVAPIVFDDAIIETPYLYGEIFPFVTVVPITRGRRIEGATISQVTLTSGGSDGTEIALFNTANFIAAFDTTIFTVNGAIEIGLDFLSDAVPDIGGMVARSYGQKLLEWLDEQVLVGDGTTEPEGIFTASGTISVSATNGATGAPTVGDYEGLLFGVKKKWKAGYQSNRITYFGTETSYQRARGIAVGTSDARRVFGMDHESYALLNHPYKINEALTNRQIGFGVLPRYRMYRRLGLTTRVSTEGDHLLRRNQMLLVARARFGGQIEDGNAFSITVNAQT